MSARHLVLASSLALAALSGARTGHSQQKTVSNPLTVVDGYLAAYNAHDAAGLRRWLKDTLILAGLPADSTDERLAPDTLIRRLQRAFARFPDLHAILLGRVANAGYVVDRYKITIGKRTEYELFAYRVEDGRISGMWDFRAGPASPRH